MPIHYNSSSIDVVIVRIIISSVALIVHRLLHLPMLHLVVMAIAGDIYYTAENRAGYFLSSVISHALFKTLFIKMNVKTHSYFEHVPYVPTIIYDTTLTTHPLRKTYILDNATA